VSGYRENPAQTGSFCRVAAGVALYRLNGLILFSFIWQANPMSEPTPSEDNAVAPIGEEGGKKSKKKLIFILVPLVLLIAGGAGLYFSGMLDKVLGKEKTEAAAGEHGEAKAEGKESEEGAAGEHGPGAEVAFLKIPDMIVNLNAADGQPRYLRLSVQLEMANAADVAAVEKVLPRVVDQFQTYLRELRVQDLRGSKGMYRLQMELLSRVNAAAAPTQVKDVLFQEILIQ
jgi:flagellar FliL protein